MALRAPQRSTAYPLGHAGTTIAVLVLAVAAWVGVVVSHSAPAAHHGHEAVAASTTTVVISLVGWTLMVLAMMLPPALPLTGLLHGLLPGRGAAVVRQASALAAFVAVWVGVGAVLVTGGAVLDTALGDVSAQTRGRLAGCVVLLAGLYQFTPVKNACLMACRTPRWFALRLWGRGGPTRDALTIAAAYGVSCVGCCWALMLLGLGTGAFALPVMVVLAVVMTAERLVLRGRALARATGVALVLLGVALVTDLLPPALVHPLLGV